MRTISINESCEMSSTTIRKYKRITNRSLENSKWITIDLELRFIVFDNDETYDINNDMIYDSYEYLNIIERYFINNIY